MNLFLRVYSLRDMLVFFRTKEEKVDLLHSPLWLPGLCLEIRSVVQALHRPDFSVPQAHIHLTALVILSSICLFISPVTRCLFRNYKIAALVVLLRRSEVAPPGRNQLSSNPATRPHQRRSSAPVSHNYCRGCFVQHSSP